MSTETKPMRLMPFTKRVGSSGRWVIEPGANDAFELPDEFRVYFEALERGASLASLADIAPAGASRFQLLKKFLLFLHDRDLLADRDYERLADSLKADYTWPVSLISTPLAEINLARASKGLVSKTRRLVTSALAFALTLLLVAVSFREYVGTRIDSDSDPSLVRSLIIFLVAFSVARSVLALWVWVAGWAERSRPRLDLVIEPLSIRLRSEHAGRTAASLLNILSAGFCLMLCFGIGNFIAIKLGAVHPFEDESGIIAASFAFFAESSPYSRSLVTDLLRSFYARLLAGPAPSGRREAVMRTVHVTICSAWVLFFGGFIALDLISFLQTTWGLARFSAGSEKIAGFLLLAFIGLFIASWLADVLSAFSYTDATTGQIRNLWQRKSDSPLAKLQGQVPNAYDLEQLPFLRQIPTEARKPLLMSAQVRAFKEGQAICRQGDRDRNLFIVLEGKLAVAAAQAVSGGRSRRKIVAWLDPGAVFGENAFFFGQPRTADVIGMEEGRVLVLPHSNTMKLVDAEKSDQLRVRIWFLQALMQSAFFKALPTESLDSILHSGHEERISAGAKVIQEGEKGDACYFIVQGRASVLQNSTNVRKLGAGDAFGEISVLLPGTLRTATVTADTDLLMIKIGADKFWKLLKSHLPLAIEIERLALRRLQADQNRART